MATKLNIGRETRKGYKKAKESYSEAIAAKNMLDDSISVYYEDKIKEAKEIIEQTIGSTKNMLSVLEKDSNKRKDYEKMDMELRKMHENIKKTGQ